MSREVGRLRTDDGLVVDVSLTDGGDVDLRVSIEERTNGPMYEAGDARLRPGQAARLADLLNEATEQGSRGSR